VGKEKVNEGLKIMEIHCIHENVIIKPIILYN
jgi:hypothetical protein